MKKRLIALIVAVALILASLGTFLIVRTVRARRAPTLESLLPRLEALLNGSLAVNRLFWGEGLPTYPRVYRPVYPSGNYYVVKDGDVYRLTEDSEGTGVHERRYYIIDDEEVGTVVAYQYYVTEHEGGNTVYVDFVNNEELSVSPVGKYRYALKTTTHRQNEEPLFEKGGTYYYALPDYKEQVADHYYDSSDDEYYDYVRYECTYLSVDDIKNQAEQVYARVYLTSVYSSLFDGVIVEGSGGFLHPRYMEYTDDEGTLRLKQSNLIKPINVERVFLLEKVFVLYGRLLTYCGKDGILVV